MTSELLTVFHLSGRDYALPIEHAVEAVRMVDLAPLPGDSPWLAGVLNLRGRLVPVMDLRARLGLPSRPAMIDDRILVVEHDGQAAGLIVDAVSELLRAPTASGSLVPAGAGPSPPDGGPVAGVTHVDERVIVVLDIARLLAGIEDREVVG